jgi:hypothetical protein
MTNQSPTGGPETDAETQAAIRGAAPDSLETIIARIERDRAAWPFQPKPADVTALIKIAREHESWLGLYGAARAAAWNRIKTGSGGVDDWSGDV